MEAKGSQKGVAAFQLYRLKTAYYDADVINPDTEIQVLAKIGPP